jgi:KaiC/GvpD/RAD55 family RecA-like ATPase
VVLLAGEPGIGKTTAARHFAAIARAGGALVLWGACLDSDISLRSWATIRSPTWWHSWSAIRAVRGRHETG